MYTWLGVLLSLLLPGFLMICAEILKRKARFQEYTTRKIIHIGVSHCWIILMLLTPQWQYAIIPPIIFIMGNFYIGIKKLLPSMGENYLGTVYYPISVLVLVVCTWHSQETRYIGAVGTFLMGYGDGIAALIGKNWGKKSFYVWGSRKTWEGSITMWLVSFTVAVIIGKYAFPASAYIQISVIIAFWAMFLEAIAVEGLDNFSVPLVSAAIAYLLWFTPNSLGIFSVFTYGFFGSLAISLIAYRKQSLTTSGAIGATILGAVVTVTTGIIGCSILLLFFLSSSALSHFRKRSKQSIERNFEKTGNRDIVQVIANGGVPFVCGILYYYTQNAVFLEAFAVAFAVANADTWATELGILNTKQPLCLRTWKLVPIGTSGAISLFGSFAALLGAAAIAAGFVLISQFSSGQERIITAVAICIAGFAGAFFDSLLGAYAQVVYWDEETQQQTEKRFSGDQRNKKLRGIFWMTNDLVNILSIALATGIYLTVPGT